MSRVKDVTRVTETDVKKEHRTVLKAWDAWFYMPVQMGMGAGGVHDFIACVPVTITPEMVGKRVGMFVSVEAKEQGFVEKFWRQYAAGKDTVHVRSDVHQVHPQFISNRPLQAEQAEKIFAAHGIAIISDSGVSLETALQAWRERLLK